MDHTEEVAEDNPITIPGIWVDRCEHCGEVVFPGETVAFIESFVAEQTEQLSQRELEGIRDDRNGPTQDEMSEILGLGRKTYHKWESGSQFPTRSMCYYIRVLAQFPEAFEWLRDRAWRKKNRLTHANEQLDLSAMFPDLPASFPQNERSSSSDRIQSIRNPARGLTRTVFPSK
jgi:DNA-binding transcriptional regulator YiaG